MARITLVSRIETTPMDDSVDAFENEGVEVWRVVSDSGKPFLVVVDYRETDLNTTLMGLDNTTVPFLNTEIGGHEVSPRLLVEACIASGEGPVDPRETVDVDRRFINSLIDQGFTLKESI